MLLWSQADWLSVPTALTSFAAFQEWEAGTLAQGWGALGSQWFDVFFLWLSQSTISLYLNSPLTNYAAVTTLHNTPFVGAVFMDLFWELCATAPSLQNFTSSSDFDLTAGVVLFDVVKINLAFLQNWLDLYVCSATPAALYSTLTTSTPTWFALLISVDPILLLAELFVVAVAALGLDRWVVSNNKQVFYDDLVTLCKYNNLSLTEVAVTLTLSVGFVFFDIFVSFAEDDVIDTLNYLILIFIILTFVFLIIAIDVQYFFMISNTGGDLTFRVIIFDLINNLLGALRVFFCWIRYVFYDLQVELVDMAFQYTDSVNEIALTAWFEVYSNNAHVGTPRTQFSLWASTVSLFWIVMATFIEVASYIFQALTGLFKLVIASFLLWLIVDLFLLRGFALDESFGLAKARTSTNKQTRR